MTNNRQPMPEAAGDPLRHELPRRDAEAVPEAEIRGWRGISIVWLVPLVAAVIGIWLAQGGKNPQEQVPIGIK